VSDVLDRVLRPREGWLSAGLLAVMLLALSWSVQSAGWLDQMDFLGPVALYAVAMGSLIALLPLSRVVALPLSATLGAVIVIWTVGGEYYTGLDQLGRLFALREDLFGWVEVLLATGYPFQMSPYALGMAALMWATGAMAAHALYRHHRVLDAIVLVGVALVANMSATFTNLFGYMLLFVVAALLLWLLGSIAARQDGWQRRRVNENVEVPGSILRSGILFAGGSVALAWILTGVAVAAPLTDAWRSLDLMWAGARDQFDSVFGSLTNPQSRIGGTSFGSSFAVSGSWFSKDDEVMVIAAPRGLYMRTVTYDLYTGRGWERTEGTRREVEPGGRLFPGETPERPSVIDVTAIETISVEMRDAIGRSLFAPGYPLKIYAPVVLVESGGQPVLGGLEAANAVAEGQAYQVSAYVSVATENELSAAGTEYPPLVASMYLDASLATDRVRDLAADVVAQAEATTPYEQARVLARFLSRDDSFSYATEADVPPQGQDLVDFFLFDGGRTGYCQYYASAMVLMARTLGIPARVAAGFAPGERTDDGTYLVRQSNAHAWAELFFPGYGWQTFEATKTINPQFVRRSGDPVTPASPVTGTGLEDLLALEGAEGALGRVSSLPTFNPVEGGYDARQGAPAAGDEGRAGNAPLVFLAIALGLVAFLWVRILRAQRRWRFLPAGDRTWQRMSFAADRAGVAPRPAETPYEYAGWLEEQIPSRRPEIRTLADGKVWQDYSGRPTASSAAARLETAWTRLRIPFALLTLRHWLRGLVRRS
ncbi:MAG: transglutaminase TgpA family protein, partial [Candidatus Limnocylindria bacterium]